MIKRKELLSKMYEADIIYNKEWLETNRDKLLYVTEYKDINESVKWLENELNLDKLQLKINTSRDGLVLEKTLFGARQYHCFLLAIENLKKLKLGSAYHEICNYIHNMEITINEPISTIELIMLSMWVKLYKNAYRELCEMQEKEKGKECDEKNNTQEENIQAGNCKECGNWYDIEKNNVCPICGNDEITQREWVNSLEELY